MSTTVRLKQRVSGRRNGEFWPEPGETKEVTDQEATDLEFMGIAEKVSKTGKPKEG